MIVEWRRGVLRIIKIWHDSNLLYLLLLTTLFFIAQISLVFQLNGLYFADYRLVAHQLTIPTSVYPGIVFYIVVQISLHFIFTLFIWMLAKLTSIGLTLNKHQTEKLSFALWIIAVSAMMVANQYFFPHSRFAFLTAAILNSTFAGILLVILSLILLIILIISLVMLWQYAAKTMLLTVVIISLFAGIHYHTRKQLTHTASMTHPNIILIGIDALRPDFLSFFGSSIATPGFDNFLDHASVFSESVTPIARTFPSWISILTGEYPKVNGIRTNLMEPLYFDVEKTLPQLLRHQGYRTIYAIDDTRFSNIDQKFGFDVTLLPPIGFNNFLLGSLNDFPLSNLVVNTAVGKWLFPYSYANRAGFITYQPQTFIHVLQHELSKPNDQPLFLAVHFCLTHYPYQWSKSSAEINPLYDYQMAVQGVDQQFATFMQLLQQENYLQHAIVVLLSDHGEAFELHGDRVTSSDLYVTEKNLPPPKFYPSSYDKETIDQSVGHGTDVLGLTQYHTVLAFQEFGLAKRNVRKTFSHVVSLLDIKPTILELLKLSANSLNGHSLLSSVQQGIEQSNAPYDLFLETDFSPQAIHSTHPEMRQVLFAGINFFHIHPISTRILVKPDMLALIYASKQYADIYGDWMLALYPQANKTMVPVLVNLRTGEWSDDLQTQFAKHSPVNHMIHAMQHFFGNDLARNFTAFYENPAQKNTPLTAN